MKTLKTSLLAGCLTLLLATLSCSDDPEPSIEGLWAIKALETFVTIIDHTNDRVFEHAPCSYDGSRGGTIPSTTRITINADNTGSLNWDGACIEPDAFSFRWELLGEGNELILSRDDDGGVWTWKVTEMTADELHVAFQLSVYREEIDRNSTRSEDITLTFERVR